MSELSYPSVQGSLSGIYFSKEEYRKNVSEAMDFLNGNYEPIMKLLDGTDEWKRQKIWNLRRPSSSGSCLNSVKQVAQKQKITVSDGEDKDIIGVDIQDDGCRRAGVFRP